VGGQALTGPVGEAVELLAVVAGQDVERGEDGTFRIARKVTRDRVVSTVDPQARHGHKSRARTFDGYKAHLGVDPDDELIINVAVTPANTPDRDVVDELLDEPADDASGEAGGGKQLFGDSAYADGATLAKLTDAGHDVHTKVPPVRNALGLSNPTLITLVRTGFVVDAVEGLAEVVG
jgi:Transposase DDE domain